MTPVEIFEAIKSGSIEREEVLAAIAQLPDHENPARWDDEFDTEGSLFELTELAFAERLTPEEYEQLMTLVEEAVKGSDTFSAPIEVAKKDEYKNLVFGWASVAFSPDGTQLIDRQGHAIDIEDLEDAAYNFTVQKHSTGDMHKSEGFGDLVESMVFTREKIQLLGLDGDSIPQGWWVGFRVPPEYHEQVRAGNRTMFSIEGTAKLEPY